MARNIYAKTEGECEAKLAARIGEMQAEIAVGKGRRNQGNQAGPGGPVRDANGPPEANCPRRPVFSLSAAEPVVMRKTHGLLIKNAGRTLQKTAVFFRKQRFLWISTTIWIFQIFDSPS